MSLRSGRMQMQEDLSAMKIQWRHVREQWQDSRATAIEKTYVEPMLREVKLCMDAITELDDLFEQIRKDIDK